MRGSIAKKGKRWYFVLPVGDLDPKTGQPKKKWFVGGDTKKEAEKACAQFLAAYDPNSYTTPSKMTFAEYFKYWIEHHVRVNLAPITQYNYIRSINRFLEFNSCNIKLEKVNTMFIQKYITYLVRKGLAPRAIKNEIAPIKSALHYAVDTAGLLQAYPIKKLVFPETEKKVPKNIDLEVIEKVFKLAEGHKYEPIALTAFSTGARVGEACGLMETNCDFNKQTIFIKPTISYTPELGVFIKPKPKTKSSERELPIGANLAQILKEQIAKQRKIKMRNRSIYNDRGLVFAQENGDPYNPKAVSNWFKYLCTKAGSSESSIHGLRHTFATWCMNNGINMADVSQLLGHSNISITLDIYSHSQPNGRRDAMSQVDALLPKKALG